MSPLVRIILSLSCSGALLILLLLICKPLVKVKLSRQWQYYIWLLVIARLLLPIPSAVNMTNIMINPIEKIIMPFLSTYGANTDTAKTVPAQTDGNGGILVSPVTASQDPGRKPHPEIWHALRYSLLRHLWLIWLFPAVILLIRKITIYQSFVKYVRASRSEVADTALLDRLAELSQQAKVSVPVELYSNSLVSSPLLLGFFRPCIVLPSTSLTATDFAYIIRHELTHCRRKDMFYKWLVQITVCLHWFNPLVHLMSREINQACELACDEAIIRRLPAAHRRAYGDTLLHAVQAGGSYHNATASVTLGEHKKQLKERLGAIMNYQKQTTAVGIATLSLTLLVFTGAAFGGVSALPKTSDPATTETIWSNAANAKKSHIYIQNAYQEGDYIIELGWNLNEEGIQSYQNKTNLVLGSKTMISASFDDACASFIQNQDAIRALNSLLGKLEQQYSGTVVPLTSPLIISIEYIGGSDLRALAREYYDDSKLTYFSAIFAGLDGQTQLDYCNQMFDDSRIAFFASCLNHMDAQLINTCAERAYQDNTISFFSVTVSHMTASEQQAWMARASRDKRTNFLAVLTEHDDITK